LKRLESRDGAPAPATLAGLCLLSASSLIFEINLTRLFSVAQFYHFAFLIVSLALLGFGASGSLLSMLETAAPADQRTARARAAMPRLALAAALSALAAYLLTNWLPFDSFSMAWDRRQIAVLAVHLVALASPFLFGGLAIGLLLSTSPGSAGQVYAVNLAGSAAGCLLALAAPAWLGGVGMVVLSAWLAALAAVVSARAAPSSGLPRAPSRRLVLGAGVLLVAGLFDLGLRAAGQAGPRPLELRLSPYKSLSYALQYPGAGVVYRRWNAFSRVDVVRSPGIRSLPGLSYRYMQAVPTQDGLLVDGDDLSPVLRPEAGAAGYSAQALGFAAYMPGAVAFELRPQAEALVLEPRGGLDIVVALALGAGEVTAVEVNPLVVEAAGPTYADRRVRTVVEASRSYLRRGTEAFDVIVLSLTSSYHPVRSGAYSLGEDYDYTVEAFEDALARLKDGGLLVATRWLQLPPSEELRAFAVAVTALERSGRDPAAHIIAWRGYNTATLLVAQRPFTAGEAQLIRAFAARCAFDLIYAPGLTPEESNQYNVLPTPVYFEAFAGLLRANPRQAWYEAYPYDVTPPTDDRPFFGHFFKWSQARQVLAELGKTWQPFGGAGYFVVLALLGLALMLATGLILLPLAAGRSRLLRRGQSRQREPVPARRAVLSGLAYFGLIGLAFLMVEIPLFQHFILFLGHPAYALTAVLFTLLLFSGLGSRLAHARWLPFRPALAGLVILVVALPWLLPRLFALCLGLSLAARLGITVLVLAPVGFLMGLPFPRGVQWLEQAAPGLIPWVWGVNGAASVVSSILAALLALSFGFRWVLLAGAACYAGAWLASAWQQPVGRAE
jgi:hypothetical protein